MSCMIAEINLYNNVKKTNKQKKTSTDVDTLEWSPPNGSEKYVMCIVGDVVHGESSV